MSNEERKSRTIYHACKHAVAAVDTRLARKSAEPYADALAMERQSYVDLGNEIAAELGLDEIG